MTDTRRRPGPVRRVARGVGKGLHALGELLVEALGELVLAALACLLLVGFLALTAFGLATAPRSTVALLAGVVALVLYGGWRAFRDPAGSGRGLLARVAVGVFVLVAAWLSYVLTYCSCV